MRRRGFSLLEALVGCSLLTGFFVTAFLLLNMGFQGYQHASARMDVYAELRGLVARIRQDAESSTQMGVQAVARTSNCLVKSRLVECRRDGLSLPAVADWRDESSFDDETGRPLWNRYVLYYAIQVDRPGPMYRCVVTPNAVFSGGRWPHFRAFLTAFPNQPPSLNSTYQNVRVSDRRTLSQKLLAFKVDTNDTDLLLDIQLYQEVKQRQEAMQVRIRLAPKNQTL